MYVLSFEREIESFLNPLKQSFGYKYTVIDGVGAYFESVLKINEISTYCVTLLIKKGQLKVLGEDISVIKYAGGDLALSGKILKVECCQ